MGWITSVRAYSEEKEESERIEGEGILPYHCLMVPAASARMSIYPQTFLIFNRDPPIHLLHNLLFSQSLPIYLPCLNPWNPTHKRSPFDWN